MRRELDAMIVAGKMKAVVFWGDMRIKILDDKNDVKATTRARASLWQSLCTVQINAQVVFKRRWAHA
jgi:hypothetical protein